MEFGYPNGHVARFGFPDCAGDFRTFVATGLPSMSRIGKPDSRPPDGEMLSPQRNHWQLPNRGKSMTVKITNRSHRVAYIVALFLLAVALTTALVMAAEQGSQSEKHVLHQTGLTRSHSLPQGPMGWECI